MIQIGSTHSKNIRSQYQLLLLLYRRRGRNNPGTLVQQHTSIEYPTYPSRLLQASNDIQMMRPLVCCVAALGFAGLVGLGSAFSPNNPPIHVHQSTKWSLLRPSPPTSLLPLHATSLPTTARHPSSSSHNDAGDNGSGSGNRPEPRRLPRGVHAPVKEIDSPQELADFINQDDRICVIKYVP